MSEIKRDPDYPSLQETMGWNDEEYDSLFDASAARNHKILQEMNIKLKKIEKFYKDERIRQGLKEDEPLVIDETNDPFQNFDAFCDSIVLDEE